MRQRRGNSFEGIMAKNLPKLMTDIKPHIQEAQSKPSKIYTKKKSTLKHILFKLQKTKHKEKIMKEARGRNTLPIDNKDKYIQLLVRCHELTCLLLKERKT